MAYLFTYPLFLITIVSTTETKMVPNIMSSYPCNIKGCWTWYKTGTIGLNKGKKMR